MSRTETCVMCGLVTDDFSDDYNTDNSCNVAVCTDCAVETCGVTREEYDCELDAWRRYGEDCSTEPWVARVNEKLQGMSLVAAERQYEHQLAKCRQWVEEHRDELTADLLAHLVLNAAVEDQEEQFHAEDGNVEASFRRQFKYRWGTARPETKGPSEAALRKMWVMDHSLFE